MFFRLNALEGPEEATNKRGGTQSIDQCKGEVRVSGLRSRAKSFFSCLSLSLSLALSFLMSLAFDG